LLEVVALETANAVTHWEDITSTIRTEEYAKTVCVMMFSYTGRRNMHTISFELRANIEFKQCTYEGQHTSQQFL